MKILFFGATGWIGSKLLKLLPQEDVIIAKSRLDDFNCLTEELNKNKNITNIILAAGLTGRPNVDWCEDHKQEVISVNVIGPGIISQFATKNKIHLTYLGTGCIYEYDKNHNIDGPGFKEIDKPNFDGSFYTYSKIMTENILKEYNNILILRIRMPLSSDLHPRNFITKITKYKKVVNVPNSMTILDDLVPLIPDMMNKNITGIYNFTNPGVINHNQILNLYIKYIDPNFTYENFSLEEQAKVIKAGRSNNCLDVSKLTSIYSIPHIQDSIVSLFEKMSQSI